jgi:outer membrane protein OmpA-like peptidoglycan-associated protein
MDCYTQVALLTEEVKYMATWTILSNFGTALGLVLLLTLTTTVYSQEEDELMMRRGASQDEIMDTLRSIRRQTVEGATALTIRIYFAYDSDKLTPPAKAELSNYGKAFAAGEFKDARWRIEGHTDASGSASYNQDLSERRARSVYNYLIEQYGINPDHLEPLGKGESDLYDPANPLSGVNRRVRITYLGG